MSQLTNADIVKSSIPFVKKKRFTLERQEALTGWLFILPELLGFMVFTFFSIGFSLWISLTKWDLLTPPVFIKLQNYIYLSRDPIFWQCLENTVFYAVTMIPLVMILSLALAITLNQKGLKFATYFKVSSYMPFVTSTIAVGMVWLWIYGPDTGLLNTVLRSWGVVNPPRWLESSVWSKPALVAMMTWKNVGYYMIFYLTGLQTIPQNLYEAAEVDGATKWQKTRYITIPLLSNTTFFVIIMLIIASFNIYEAVFIMTQGGPANSTNTILYYIYDKGFTLYKMGYAASLSWVLFAMVFILTLIEFRLNRNKE